MAKRKPRLTRRQKIEMSKMMQDDAGNSQTTLASEEGTCYMAGDMDQPRLSDYLRELAEKFE